VATINGALAETQSLQVSMSILRTRFSRFAQVIEARFSAGVWSAVLAEWDFLGLPRLAGVTLAPRCFQLVAHPDFSRH